MWCNCFLRVLLGNSHKHELNCKVMMNNIFGGAEVLTNHICEANCDGNEILSRTTHETDNITMITVQSNWKPKEPILTSSLPSTYIAISTLNISTLAAWLSVYLTPWVSTLCLLILIKFTQPCLAFLHTHLQATLEVNVHCAYIHCITWVGPYIPDTWINF